MKKLSAILIVSLIYTSVLSQGKLILSDSFKVNTNNWLLVSKKNLRAAMGKEISSTGAYLIENYTKDIFTTLIPSLPDPEKDFRITIRLRKGFIEPGFKKDPYQYDEGFGIVFGAKDEQNFFVFQLLGKGYFRMAEYENGKQKSILNGGYAQRLNNSDEKIIKIVSDNNLWKVFVSLADDVILNVPSSPLYGNKIGFRAGSIENYFVSYLSVHEVEKKKTSALTSIIAAANSFPTPAFHTVFPDVLCEMFNRFRDIMDKPYGSSADSNWLSTKRIPGFGPLTIIHKKNYSDLGCVVKFKKMDDALVYFEEVKTAFEITPRHCFTLEKYFPNYITNKEIQDKLKKYTHWTTELFRDPESGMVFRSIIELSIPNSLGDYGDVELHIILLAEKK